MDLEMELPAAAAATKPRPPKLVAVIDIGATSIRMAIAEIGDGGQFRTLESLAQAVSLGKDTFSTGAIDPATTEECVRVLKSYRHLLNEYEITRPDQIHVVATSAVREAVNRLSFLKRIYVATGFNVEPFDEAAVNRVTYLGVLPLLASEPRLAEAKTLIVEVGGGSTEVLADRSWRRGFCAHLPAGLPAAAQDAGGLSRARRQGAGHHGEPDHADRGPGPQARPDRPLADHDRPGRRRSLRRAELLPSWDGQSLATVPVAELRKFTEKVLAMSVDEFLHKFHLAFPDAEALGPALLTYVRLARALLLEEILVSPHQPPRRVDQGDGVARRVDGKLHAPDHPLGPRFRPPVRVRRAARPARRGTQQDACSGPCSRSTSWAIATK